MPIYLTGVISAFASPVLHGWANIFDSYLSNKIFQRITTLILLSSALSVLLLPLLWLFARPHLLSGKLLAIVAIISLIEVMYQFPYYWAFRKADTSVVTSLFSFGEIMVPFLAFVLVRERLSVHQYIGYFIVTISASLLGFEPRKFRLNQASLLMLSVSAMLALQTVLYKFAYLEGADWTSLMTWSSVMQLCISMVLAFGLRSARQDIVTTGRRIQHFGLPVIVMQLLTWGGEASEAYSLSLIPASVVNGIGSTQPLFVLAFAAILMFRKPNLIREQLDRASLWRKLCLLGLLGAGTILVAAV